MAHYDDDVLALIALGEPVDLADPEHLQTCAVCRGRLDELSSTVAIARSVSPDDQLQAPPDHVWAGIQHELSRPEIALAEDEYHTPAATNLDAVRRSKSSRAWLLVAAAAVVGLIAGGAVTARVINAPQTNDVVASGSLAPVGASTLSGTASVSRVANGAVLTVDIPGLPSLNDGYYEVWMATADAKNMVSVGTVSPGQAGTFNLPSGMNLAAFPLVDVSVEHFDGNPAHSSESVVRGLLQT